MPRALTTEDLDVLAMNLHALDVAVDRLIEAIRRDDQREREEIKSLGSMLRLAGGSEVRDAL